jgi:hypothetical protein
LRDLNIDTDVARVDELSRHREFVGSIVKLSPRNGTAWEEWSRPIFIDLNEYSGQFLMTISMSVWIDSPDTRSRTEHANFGWTLQNGDFGFMRLGSPVYAQTGRWVNLEFSQIVDIAESGWRGVFLDGNNEEAQHNLMDLILFIRHFRLTMEEVPMSMSEDEVVFEGLNVNTDYARKEVLREYGNYAGNIVKVLPRNRINWEDYSRPVFWDLNAYSGEYLITVSMSVWIDAPDSRSSTEPAGLRWTIQNGGGFSQFGSNADAPTGRWVDLLFSQTVNIAESGNRQLFLEGNNVEAGHGLLDLTLYIRQFSITMEKR